MSHLSMDVPQLQPSSLDYLRQSVTLARRRVRAGSGFGKFQFSPLQPGGGFLVSVLGLVGVPLGLYLDAFSPVRISAVSGESVCLVRPLHSESRR